MAAPAVSAAAALIHSLGTFTPDQVEQVLKASATTPPTYNANYDCGTLCGAGILNLANIPAPIGMSTLTGATSVGSVLTVSPAGWNGKPDDVTVQWTRAGKTIDGATGLSYTVTPDDLGRTLTARPIAHKQGFPDVVGLSVAKPIPKAASTTSLQLSALTAKRKSTRLIARISLTVPQGLTPSGTVSIHVGSKRVATIDLKAETREVSLPVFSETGTFSLKAVYVGDDKLLPSTSPIVKVKVTS